MRRRWGWVLASFVFLVVAAAFTYPLVATATDDVGFCLSCHVMTEQGETHAASFHREVATCSDCHTGSLVQKYTDGARHLTGNLLGKHPAELAPASREVVAGQCFSCHAELSQHARHKRAAEENCLECHKGHSPRSVILPGVDK